MAGVDYDRLAKGYAAIRRPDPRVAALIQRALGDAASIVNVGAGTGSYEPTARRVVAVEPSAVMLRQRPRMSAPAVRAVAEALPFRDRSFDASMAIFTVHHWADLTGGLAELRRVATTHRDIDIGPRDRAVLLVERVLLPRAYSAGPRSIHGA